MFNPGEISPQYKVGYQQFRVLDSERPRISNGQGRILKVSVWYPVDPENVALNPSPAAYDGGWLLPSDFIPDNEVTDDITAGNLLGVPPPYLSKVAIDGSNLPISSREKFPLVVITPSATIPIWTFASGFAETAASHGMVVIAVEALIGDGWRTRLGFAPAADTSNLNNRTEDISFVIDLMTHVERWTEVGDPDPALNPPNNYPKLVDIRNALDKDDIGILTSSGGGGPMFEYAARGNPNLKALSALHSYAFTLTPERLAQIRVPVIFNSGQLDTTITPVNVKSTFDTIGTPSGNKYLVETLGATHFDGITCAAADGLYRPSALLMTGAAKSLSNTFANIYDSLCINQTDISSDEVGGIAISNSVAMFKVYLSHDGRYKPYLTPGYAVTNKLPVIYYTSINSAKDASN